MSRFEDLYTVRFGSVLFGSVNDTEASVFGYSVFTRFVRPLIYILFSMTKGMIQFCSVCAGASLNVFVEAPSSKIGSRVPSQLSCS